VTIKTCTDHPDNLLEQYRPKDPSVNWTRVASGRWEEDLYHSGHIAYDVAKSDEGTWVLDGVERNAELDGLTEEDVEEGRVNDDQLQAMWGMTLAEAQDQEYQRIVAVAIGVPRGVQGADVGKRLYDAVCAAGGKAISEAD
jgi:hypothetical protein